MRYSGAFGTSYQENYDARAAVKDLELLESLQGEKDVAMQFYHPVGTPENRMRFKVMQLHQPLALSDVIPVLDRVPVIEGLVVGAGFSGHGFGIGPGAGHLIADGVGPSAAEPAGRQDTGPHVQRDPSPLRHR